jgi:hypothetical protein
LDLESVADLFESVFNAHYKRTPSGPSAFEEAMLHHGLSDMWYREGQPVLDVIQEVGGCAEEVAKGIRETLDLRHSTRDAYEMGYETEFDSESHYDWRQVGSGELDAEWSVFEHSLKSESRYFSRTAMRMLEKVFHDLSTHRTYQGGSVIVDAGPNAELKSLYRARVFQSDRSLLAAIERPEVSIGPPPPRIAGAGRMNARGIPVFYGATAPEVALAEVRPPVGSKVVVARFDIIRPLRLLDVEALQNVSVAGSLFDPMYLDRSQKAAFLRGLSERITVPVMPEGEALDYIATQVIAEYLASLEDPSIDGMIYPSVQVAKGMKNVVLFHKAAVVAPVNRPSDVKFVVSDHEHYEEGPQIEYIVREEFDSEAAIPPKEPELRDLILDTSADPDPREPALELSKDKVRVHHIQGVEISSKSFTVNRDAFDKKDFREFKERQDQQQKRISESLGDIEF